MILGKNLIIKTNVGGSLLAVAACKSCKLHVSQSFIDTCSPTQGDAFNRLPTVYEWSLSSGCLVVNSQYALQFLEALKNKSALTVQFEMLGFKQTGTVYVRDWDGSGNVGSLANLQLEFIGSGALTTVKNWYTIQQVKLGNGGANYYSTNVIYNLTGGVSSFFVGQEIRLVPVGGTSSTPVVGTITHVNTAPPGIQVTMAVDDTLTSAYNTITFNLQTY